MYIDPNSSRTLEEKSMMRRRNSFRIAVCLTGALFLLLMPMGVSQDKNNSGNPSPVGSWFGYATTQIPNFPPIWMMPTFFADGNVIANDSFELFGKHTTAHGTWKWTHAKQFEATFYWINLDPASPAYGGSNKVVMVGEIDPKNKDEIINGSITSTFYSAECGNPLKPVAGCTTPEPLIAVITELLRAK
jgi:hypothetical protein